MFGYCNYVSWGGITSGVVYVIRRSTAPAAPLTPLAWLAPLRSSVLPRVSAASRGKLAGGKLAGESAETEATQTSGASRAAGAELAERS